MQLAIAMLDIMRLIMVGNGYGDTSSLPKGRKMAKAAFYLLVED